MEKGVNILNKIRTGDLVQVIAGKDKGKRGKILKILQSKSSRGSIKVIVEGVRLATKSQKPDPQREIPGGFVQKELPIDISNVAYFDEATGKKSKVGIKITAENKKVRFLKANNQVIEQA